MIAVPALKAQGLNTRSAHRSSVAFILPLSALSAVLYLVKGNVTLSDAWPFVPWGLVGAAVGTLMLKKMTPAVLRRIFGALMIFAGVKILLSQ